MQESEITESLLNAIEAKRNGNQSTMEAIKDAVAESKNALTDKGIFLQALDAIAGKYPDQKDAIKRLYTSMNPHIKDWNSYISSIVNYDESHDFISSIFSRRFPIGTISYIGARPGRGKTTMLVNIALDAVQQGKKAVYVTAEETTKQLINRLILCKAYERNVMRAESDYRAVQLKDKMLSDSIKPRTCLFAYIKDTASNLSGIEAQNADMFEQAATEIRELITSQKLTIFEAYGATWKELEAFLKLQESESVVLVDYIQHLRSPENIVTQSRQIQIQETSHTLADIAGMNGLIMISGAQFNREARKGGAAPDMEKSDNFDETSFREAGDIEQDGHILIGIGKNPKTKEFFYSCMKDREAPSDNGKKYCLEADFRYSYLRGKLDSNGKPIEYTDKGKSKETKDGKESPFRKIDYNNKNDDNKMYVF